MLRNLYCVICHSASSWYRQHENAYPSWPIDDPDAVGSDEVLKAVGRSMNAKERAARVAAIEQAKKKA